MHCVVNSSGGHRWYVSDPWYSRDVYLLRKRKRTFPQRFECILMNFRKQRLKTHLYIVLLYISAFVHLRANSFTVVPYVGVCIDKKISKRFSSASISTIIGIHLGPVTFRSSTKKRKMKSASNSIY